MMILEYLAVTESKEVLKKNFFFNDGRITNGCQSKLKTSQMATTGLYITQSVK